jgi:hypothetical protein
MYSEITKIYDRKTVAHIFTKPVQIEGTTQIFLLRKLLFIVVHTSTARRCECTIAAVKNFVSPMLTLVWQELGRW